MELIIIINIISALLILAYALNINLKQVKEIAEKEYDKEIIEEVEKLPKNTKICEEILKELKNDNVKIKEDENYNTSLYTIYNNTILIGKIKNKLYEVQTIAHECIHSIQSKRTQKLNFFISNIYILYFYFITIETVLGKILNWNNIIYTNWVVSLVILFILSFIQFAIRSLLETEAILEAKYVAKKYFKKIGIKKEIIDKIMEEYTHTNKIGINVMQYTLILKNMMKILIYTALVGIIKII